MIRILYFARFREELASDSELMEPAPGVETLGALVDCLRQRGGAWDEVFGGDQVVLAAVNQEMAGMDSRIRDGDEVAFFPPVTGG
jgi:molybdopterin synthase sulfur carrier subunit